MNRKNLTVLSTIILLSIVFTACTRSASGGPSDVPADESDLPNPVSTQSQLMKDIIAGTQTAMALPLDATEEAPADGETTDGEGEADVEATAVPDEEEEEPISLPTSTPGPPPVVELQYNTKKCGPNVYLCIVSYEKDQSVTVQATYPWLLDDMDLTFKLGPDGIYVYDDYIVAGTAKYQPDGSAGYGFQATLNIPDSLRGTGTIVVRLETNNTEYFGMDFFANE